LGIRHPRKKERKSLSSLNVFDGRAVQPVIKISDHAFHLWSRVHLDQDEFISMRSECSACKTQDKKTKAQHGKVQTQIIDPLQHTHTHAKTFGVDQMAVRFGVGLGVVCVVVGSCELEVRPELVLHSEENNFSE